MLETDEIEAYYNNRKEKMDMMKKKRTQKERRSGVKMTFESGEDINKPKDPEKIEENLNKDDDSQEREDSDMALKKYRTQMAMRNAQVEKDDLLRKMAKSSRTRDFISYMPMPLRSVRR